MNGDNLLRVRVVAGVVLERDGRYLLVQEAGPKARGLWNLPAGRVEVGDTIEQTAIKEAKEETGFDVELDRKIGVYHENLTEPVKHAFTATIIGGELVFPKDEIMDAKWLTLGEIKDLDSQGKLRGQWVHAAIDITASPGK